MKAPEATCKDGGQCSFRFNYEKQFWVCRRCKKTIPLVQSIDNTTIDILLKHSSGDWFIDPIGPKSTIACSDGKQIATVNNFSDQNGIVTIKGVEHDANALLIASAPMLLKEVVNLRRLSKPRARAKRRIND